MSAMLIALAFAAPGVRAADEPNPWKFEFHGWVSASMYYQDQVFAGGQGQGLLYSAAAPNAQAPCEPFTGVFACGGATATGGTATKSGSIMSGDLRNSRFSFSMAGPKVFDGAAQPRAYMEFDFFGVTSAGAFGAEQPHPRLRVGYAELKFGNSNLQIGQQNQLVVVQIPGSLSHVANPVTYGAGTIGWRTPGIRFTQTIPIDAMKLELAAEAVANKWSNGTTSLATTPAGVGMGEASGMPMFQARAKLDGKAGDLTYMAYLVGVYHTIDLEGFGGAYTLPAWSAGKKTINGNVFEVGGKFTYAPVALSFNYYMGNATANMLGSQLVFGDIADTGYWVQLAGNVTKELSINVAYGANTPDEKDIRRVTANGAATNPNGAGARLDTTIMGGMVKYQDGGYALGLEYWANKTTWATVPTSATATTTTDAMQILFTGAYFF
jgi:hypothetical protein